jgi:site-specific DNA recombinase
MPSTNGHGSTPERVALYLRVSSEEQRDRETIEIQREFLEQYRSLYELQIAEIYEDDGISGTVPLHERPEGRRLLEDAREGKFGAVLVYKLDRLGRSLLVIVDAHDRLQEAGVALRSGTEPIDTSTPSGRLIFQMLASFAEYDRENIRERTQAGMRRAFREGKHTGVIPYGYRVRAEDGRLEVVEEEAGIVREIFANVAGGSTPYGEAKRLNELGVPPPGYRYRSGKWHPGVDDKRKPATRWSPKAVASIVRQRAYSGVHEVRFKGDAEAIERQVPPILDQRGLQDRAIAALLESGRRNREGDRKYLLSGLVRCADCGYGCSPCASWSKGKRYSYYTCISNRVDRNAAPHRAPHVRAEWLEEIVWADVRRFLENPGEVLERVKEQLSSEDEMAELEARRDDLGCRLAEKRAEKDRYVKLYARGSLSEDELDLYLTDLKNATDNLKLLLETADAELTERLERAETAEGVEAWLLSLRERLAEVEEDTEEAYQVRHQLVRLLVAGIEAGRDSDGRVDIRITYRFGTPAETSGAGAMFASAGQNSKS